MIRVVCCVFGLWICFVSGQVVENPNLSFCESAREAANDPLGYVPNCAPDGTFAPQQCHNGTGYCWCADSEGNELPNTRVRFYLPGCGQVSKKCSRVLPVGGDLLNYLFVLVDHVLKETTIAESFYPPFLLATLRDLPEGQIPYIITQRTFTEITQLVCKIADAESISEITQLFKLRIPSSFVPAPLKRKKIVLVAYFRSLVAKQILGDLASDLAKSGFPEFPLKRVEALNKSFDAYLSTAEKIYSMIPDIVFTDNIPPEERWASISEIQKSFFNCVAEAQSKDDSQQSILEEFLIEPEVTSNILDIITDVVQNTEMYLGAFDVIGDIILSAIQIGILDLPEGDNSILNGRMNIWK